MLGAELAVEDSSAPFCQGLDEVTCRTSSDHLLLENDAHRIGC